MRLSPFAAGLAVVLTLTACSDDTPKVDADVAMCQELSRSWTTISEDESAATMRRIGEALASSGNADLRQAGSSYLEFASYPRDADGNIAIDAAREHYVDLLVAIKTVAAGCTAIGVELSDEMREAAELAEQLDGLPTDGQTEGNDPVTVAIGETALMEGEEGAIKVTVSAPEQHDQAPDGEKPENDVLLVMDVHFEGVEGSYLYSGLTGFTFVAADGQEYYPAYFPSFGPELPSGSYGPGDKADGTLVFDLPAAAIEGGKILLEGFGMDFTALPGAIWTL